ncbi:MAG: FAD-linked oxidase C-terminal domain-containing protein [Acidimicrobiia bacterium]|nr:FAD-linked oxidase C-terminal domain-containing protein [Acidimicrobiia bacterium]
MTLVDDLRAILGSDRVHSHPLELLVYNKDAGVTTGEVVAAVLPETTQEVAACVRVAARHGVPVVARGAGTGLAGGAVPTEPALLIVLTRINEIWDVDTVARTAWVGPGVINLDLSRHTEPLGLHYAPDPSSQAACTIGGNVGANAGGPHCLAEGTTVAHILAVEMVTADGDVVVLGGKAPDPPGLDLRGVVVGSEGTLGIVTGVLVKLTQNAPAVRTLLLTFDSIQEAAGTVSAIVAAGIIPAALEMMDRPMVVAVEAFINAGLPVDAEAVLLAEVVGLEAGVAAESQTIERIAGEQGATSVRIAADDAERALLWKARKSAFGAVAQAAPDYYLHDTVVPRTALVDVITEVYAIGERYDVQMLNVFHAGDGNLHPLVAYDSREPGKTEQVRAAAEEMVRVSVAAGGSLTGEHGVGLEKRDLMPLVFAPVDLDAQARLREAFDPEGLLNPGKILPRGSRCYDYGLTALPGEAAP